MVQGKELKTYTYGPASGVKPKNIVFLLHGLGSNGQDLISLAPFLAKTLPDTVFVSPDAPFPCDMAPFGYQWFSLQVRTDEALIKGVEEAHPVLSDYIDAQLAKYDLGADKAALLGFSQGTMMSLYTGPRYKECFAGILGYSGALVWGDDMIAANLHKMPIMLIHGDEDDVVPLSAYKQAKKTLEEGGYDVQGEVTEGLSHGIDESGIRDGAAFLSQIFS